MPDVAGNDCVVKEVRFPERLTIILLELSGFAISARMAEQQPDVLVPEIVSPVPVTRMPPSPVGLSRA
jgi:hypothetical protein